MSNPLFNEMQNGQQNAPMQNILRQFNQFRQNFRGDPQQMVQQMLNSGRITQEQYNRAVQMANQLQRYIKM